MISTLSMLFGGMLYIAFRKESLRMFEWFNDIGVNGAIQLIRQWAYPLREHIPNVVVYSAPNALWYFSGLLAFSGIWREHKEKYFWICIVSIIAFGAELGQALKIVAGSYNDVDMAFVMGTLPLFFVVEELLNKRRCNERNESF